MGTEYYLCDREKQEVLYYGKSFCLSDSWYDDMGVTLTSAHLLRSIDAESETRRMTRAALWCEGRERVEVMADVALDNYAPWEEFDGGEPFPKTILRGDWTCWTADVFLFQDEEDEGWKPFRLTGE